MSGKLRLLDLALLVVAGLLFWHLRARVDRFACARSGVAAQRSARRPRSRSGASRQSGCSRRAADFADVATQNLFSQDRNPNAIVDPPPPPPEKPQPPFPVAHGVMLWDGVPPTIVLSEKSGGPQKGYHPGDTIGQWKLVSVDNSYADFEWDGKEFKKRIDELIDRTPIAQAAPPRSQVGRATSAAAADAQTLSTSIASRPGRRKWALDSRRASPTTVSRRHGCGWHEEGRHRHAIWKRVPLGTDQVKEERGNI